MALNDERPYTKTNFYCSTCWKGFVDKDICMEHMLRHVSDNNRNNGTETSWNGDGECQDSGLHKTDDKTDDYDYSVPVCVENQPSGMCKGNTKTQSYMVKKRDDQASMSVENTHNRTNSYKCKEENQAISKRTTSKTSDLKCGDGVNLSRYKKVPKTVGNKIFICEVCNKQFTLRYRYVVHSKIHKDDRPHQCEICNKRFIEKTNLTTHMRYHTKSDLLYCDICRKEFIKKSALVKHMKVHSDERPYKCTYCESSFKREHHLARHELRHCASRPRPYRCDKCDIGYLDPLSLTRHNQSYHNDNRDIIQTNFKTRNRKAVIRSCHNEKEVIIQRDGKAVIADNGSDGSQMERTTLENGESESVNIATASTLLELGGLLPSLGYPQPDLPSPPGTSSVSDSRPDKIISFSGLPSTSSPSVEPMISLVDRSSSKLYEIITSSEDNGLSNVSEIPLALPLETQSSTMATTDSSEVLPQEPQSPTAITDDLSDVPLAVPLETQSFFVMTDEPSVDTSSLTVPLATERSTDVLEVSCTLPLETQSSFVVTAEPSVVSTSLTMPLATQTSIDSSIVSSSLTMPLATQTSTDSSEAPLALSLETQSSLMPANSSEVLSSLMLPLGTQRSTAGPSEIPLAVPLKAQSSFLMTTEHSVVSSSLAVPLATQRFSKLTASSSEVPLTVPLEAQSSFVITANSSEVPPSIALPLATQRSNVLTTSSSEVPLTVPLEAQSSFVMTADSSDGAFAFKNDTTGIISLLPGVHNSPAMPHLSTLLPQSSNISINQTSDLQETYYVEILPTPVSQTSTSTVGNDTFSDVFKRVPVNNAKKRKSTTNFPQRVHLRRKRSEEPHKLWTYM